MEPFSVAMGVATHPRRIAIGSKGLIWMMESAGRDLAQRLAPAGKYDAALLTRSCHVTGNIQNHEMAFVGEDLWVVNTLFSCLATIQPGYNFVPRWKPKFISNCHEPGDRCHLNGLAIDGGRPKYVTAMAETDTPGGWRPDKHKTGVLIDVPSNEVVARGFAMLHSPRVYAGKLWLLDSGRGQLVLVDPHTGKWDVVTTFPGYTRGLAFLRQPGIRRPLADSRNRGLRRRADRREARRAEVRHRRRRSADRPATGCVPVHRRRRGDFRRPSAPHRPLPRHPRPATQRPAHRRNLGRPAATSGSGTERTRGPQMSKRPLLCAGLPTPH